MILILVIFYYSKNYVKIFQFKTYHTKLVQVQNHCVSGSIKQMDLLGFNPANTRCPRDVHGRSPKGSNILDLQGTLRRILEDQHKK